MKTILQYAAAVWLLLAAATTVSAQQDTSAVRNLDSVIVTAEKIRKEIIPVQTLSGAALKNLSVLSVADATRYFAGVQVKDYGGIGGLKTVNVRNLGTQHVGVFYDGIELGNAQNGTVDLGRFSLDNMVSVSLYNGQKSNIFQPAKDFASASSVYLTSRIPEFTEDSKNNYTFRIRGGSFGTINPALLWEHQLSDKISTSFNAEYMRTDGNYKFRMAKKDGYDTTQRRYNGDLYSVRIETGLFGKIKDGEWKAKLYWYNSERGYPGASVREEPGKFYHQDRQLDNNFFFQTGFRKNFSKFYSLQLNGKYAYDYMHYTSDPRVDVTTMYVSNTFKQQEGYFSAANLFTLTNWWSVNASADLLYNKLDANLINFVYPRRLTTLAALASSIQWNRLKFQASMLGTFVNEDTKLPLSSAKNKEEFTPSLILSYQPWKQQDFHLRAFYKRIFRMPTMNDLYYTFIGNAKLLPEYTTQYNLGFTFAHRKSTSAFRSIELQADGYYNEVNNKIVAMPNGNLYRWMMMNYGYVKIHGLDMSVQTGWQLAEQLGLNARLSYTWQRAVDYTDKTEINYGHLLPYAPEHSGSAILSFVHKQWNFNYSFLYTGERWEPGENNDVNYVRSWYTSDVAVIRTLELKKKIIRLGAELNNVFNQQYDVVLNYPMPGISYRLTASISL
ncbi:TonB-dependent receptor [Pseudoflavitalea sp. G-6-1-2]|uniref:TonB-dependent receptor n=1 Tax=Pseudoflavitalea sp. G-6-1-2 TaxID=2728841 RepID=UPI00146B08A0|nr:TonB-dependent receptor [Pseudoflavitalea sp. G-6-1-2]NML23805.1 TonB-dependent receptor [Pseudoflavitalea sp. G-6-1-2]